MARRVLTYELCKEIASRYPNAKQLELADQPVCTKSRKMGWLKEFYPFSSKRNLTYEYCLSIAKQCSSRVELYRMDSCVYGKIYRKGWMPRIMKECNYVVLRDDINYQTCREAASKCKSRTEFDDRFAAKCRMARQMGWLDEFAKEFNYHVKRQRDYDTCYRLASQCHSRKELSNLDSSIYDKCRRMGWLDIFAKEFNWKTYSELMLENNIKKGITLSTADITSIAKQYKRMCDFRAHDPDVYGMAGRRGLLKTFTWLKRITDEHPFTTDNVYVYEFAKTRYAYVGRSYNMAQRHKQHCAGNEHDTLYRYSIESGEPIPEPKILHTGLTLQEGITWEIREIENYKNAGWHLINKAAGGSLGGLARFTSIKHAIKVAKRYEYKGDFAKDHPTLCNRLARHGILDKCDWLKLKIGVPQGHWNVYENCLAEAKKYKTRYQFERYSSGAYWGARRNGWLDDYTWLTQKTTKNGYWNVFEHVAAEAQKYDSLSEFQDNAYGAWNAARKHGWLDKLFARKITGGAKKVLQYSVDGNYMATFNSIVLASQSVGVDASQISKVCRGQSPTAGGFVWKYADAA